MRSGASGMLLATLEGGGRSLNKRVEDASSAPSRAGSGPVFCDNHSEGREEGFGARNRSVVLINDRLRT